MVSRGTKACALTADAGIDCMRRILGMGAQVITLWSVLRAFAATHPDLPALIAELKKIQQYRQTHDLVFPVADRALDLSQEVLSGTISLLEELDKSRRE